jgi:hypothetical protein
VGISAAGRHARDRSLCLEAARVGVGIGFAAAGLWLATSVPRGVLFGAGGDVIGIVAVISAGHRQDVPIASINRRPKRSKRVPC